MANLRPVSSQILSSSEFAVTFTDSLDPLINSSNVVITTTSIGADNPKVLSVSVSKAVLSVITEHLQPYTTYEVAFIDSTMNRFKSLNGTAFILNDGTNNVIDIIGPADPANKTKDSLKYYLSSQETWDIDNQLTNDILNSQADSISRAEHDINQLKNDNYLKVLIENEKHVRGAGPTDRFNEEGVYELIKVSRNLIGTQIADYQSFSSFPSYPISLQATAITNEKLIPGNTSGTFTGILLTANNAPVLKVTRILIVYGDGTSFNYDVTALGYQINSNRYDQDFASSYLLLESNQIRLNTAVFDNTNFSIPGANDLIYIDYQYKSIGKIVDESSVTVSQTLQSLREVTPPITNKFSLQNYPITTQDDVLINLGGVTFLDPKANPPFSAPHPAFLRELPYRIEGLPTNPGDYTVDYSTGTVFTYGAVANDGTGNFPPTATYYYRKLFTADLDYTFDPDTYELVRSPLRDLEGQIAKISFTYESTLVAGLDFIPQIHTEVLDERVGNKITSTNSLITSFGPITDVFRVYNETSGEIYRPDYWIGNTIYFTPNNPPTVTTVNQERVTFSNVDSELLLVHEEFNNILNTRIFKILLMNNRIIASTEDGVGSSFNSSVSFSQTDIFKKEIYYDWQTETEEINTDRLTVGQYQIDYENGVVYVGVANSNTNDIGTINYKRPVIVTNFSHIYAVNNLYSSIDILESNKVSYSSFNDTEVFPSTFDLSDERFLNGDPSSPYIVVNNTITVQNDILELRGVYDHFDLTNNLNPINFANLSTFSANVITLGAFQSSSIGVIQSGNNIILNTISPGIELANVISVIRLSDNVELYGAGSSFSGYTIHVTQNTPVVGQAVSVIYQFKLNGAATPVVDYSKGNLLIDYQYVTDEILVSYEYGDNCLDFTKSTSVSEGDVYYTSYKVGALRNALLKNFGSLVNIPILNTFDTSIPRERYRDALTAALQSFTKGPTIPSIKSLVQNITHIDPELIEAIFEHWVLGYSYLNRNPIKTTGDLKLLSGKFDSGALVDQPGQTISFPVSSNIRLEEGSLETWIIPEWNGLDNDATLTFSIQRNGLGITAGQVWIGSSSRHPILNNDGTFTVQKHDSSGVPSAIFTQIGLFIYYDINVNLWKIYVKDSVNIIAKYVGTVTSSGEVYNVNYIPGLNEISDILQSNTNSVYFELNIDALDGASPDGYTDGYSNGVYFPLDGYVPGYSFDGFSMMADNHHYIFDFGTTDNKNRMSLFKDGSGYLVFGVYDKNGSYRYLSKDVSAWKAGEKHHVGMSWNINTADLKDEMHLFVDGFEVPNILKYGGRPAATSTDRFRTVKPEILLGTVPKNTVRGTDAQLTSGSNIVISPGSNFSLSNILPGDIVQFLELGLGSYTIASVSGHQLTLTSPIPLTFSNAKFSVNPYSAVVASQINFYKNIVVSIIRNGVETEIPGVRADVPDYQISKNAQNQDVLTILGGALAGDQISIRTLGLNYKRLRERQYIYGNNSNIIKTQLPAPINLSEVNIYAALLPLTAISSANSTLSGGIFTSNVLTPTQPTSPTEGRTLAVRITGSNVNFTTPVTVTISGSSTEVLTFTAPGIKNTVNKYKSLTGVVVVAKPFDTTLQSTAVEIKEAYSVTYSEGNNIYPVLRYSAQISSGITLSGSGSTIIDTVGRFLDSDINQYVVISSPAPVAGTYTITGRIDGNTVTVSPALPVSFTGGSYKLYHLTIGNAGFVNGFFTLERAGAVGVPYLLPQGFYDFDYSVYLSLPFDPISNEQAYVGSDRNGKQQAAAIIDEFRILSKKMTDVRIGESFPANQEAFTIDFTKIKPFKKNADTLMLIHFDDLPLTNDSDYWSLADGNFIQSAYSVNSNFSKALSITNRPYIIDNDGILSTFNEGTIEFWVNTRYDTVNDPNLRYFFDASAAAVEEVTSISSGTVKTAGKIKQIVSITLKNDPAGLKDYGVGATIAADGQTIQLHEALPYQNTPVKIAYIPSGVSGDRISIYKDEFGFINFKVSASGKDYQVSQFASWARDTWHRVMVTYKFNRKDNKDELRLFVDGEEGGVIKFGTGLKFGQGWVFGQRSGSNSPLVQDINFKDSVNQLFIGSDYIGYHPAFARFDNMRFSNIAQQTVTIAGQSKDLNYNSNINTVLPVVSDLYTTKLIDFDTTLQKVTDFAILRDEAYGIFNFTLNVIDSFDIVLPNPKIKQILETLVSILKPAPSKVQINYFT